MGTFGNTGHPASVGPYQLNQSGCARFTLTENGYITKLTFYCSANAGVSAKGCIWAADGGSGEPGTLMGVSEAVAVGETLGEHDFAFASPVYLAAGDYYLGFVSGGSDFNVYYDTDAGRPYRYDLSLSYATPTAWQNATDNHLDGYTLGLYATYSLPVAPAPVYAYADFEDINAGTVFSKAWRDQRFVLGLRDLRDGINIKLPEETYSIEEFPAMDDSLAGKTRPFSYGTITNQVANRINATDGVFEFHHGRCKTVSHVYKNAVEITIDTDCFIDYQRGRVVLSAAQLAAWTDSDILTVDFTGWCNTADEAYTKAADVFIDAHMRYAGLGVADLNTDAIYKAKLDATETLAFVVNDQTELQDIARILERSVGASSYQDGSGRLGLRVSPSTAPGSVVYIKNAHVFDLQSSITLDSIYSAVVVKYGRNPQDDTWQTATKAINRAEWDYRKRPALEVETYLTSASDALALALEIVARLEKPRVGIEVPGMLLGTYPGDVVYLTRDRYPSASGTAANVLMRVMKITKSLSENKTIIEAEEV